MSEERLTRREIIKKAAYVTPAILTMSANFSFASAGSGNYAAGEGSIDYIETNQDKDKTAIDRTDRNEDKDKPAVDHIDTKDHSDLKDYTETKQEPYGSESDVANEDTGRKNKKKAKKDKNHKKDKSTKGNKDKKEKKHKKGKKKKGLKAAISNLFANLI